MSDSVADRDRWFVTTDWLAQNLGAPDLVVVDGSYYLPEQRRDAAAEYLAGHIPGAVRFDIDEIADHTQDLPHMLPSAEVFSEKVGALGIGDGDRIVAYDGLGLFSSPRVWWTFHVFGARQVFILDGGLPKWKAEGRPLESGPVSRAKRRFTARKAAEMVASLAQVQAALASKSAEVVDARSAQRFFGQAPEPRPGVRPGHIPGSFNVPASALIENGRLLAQDRLIAAFKAGKVDIDKPIITSCGSGVTAAILWLALETLGRPPKALYDGSWAEWGSGDLPVATSAASSP